MNDIDTSTIALASTAKYPLSISLVTTTVSQTKAQTTTALTPPSTTNVPTTIPSSTTSIFPTTTSILQPTTSSHACAAYVTISDIGTFCMVNTYIITKDHSYATSYCSSMGGQLPEVRVHQDIYHITNIPDLLCEYVTRRFYKILRF